MKGENIILIGVGASAIAASLKMAFEFGAKWVLLLCYRIYLRKIYQR